MGDNPERKSGNVTCRKCVVDLPHRNGRAPTTRLPGERLGNTFAKEHFISSTPGPTLPGKWRETEISGALTWKLQRSALGHANDDDDDM